MKSGTQENKVLISACDATTTTYVVHAFFQPVPCFCYAHTFDGSGGVGMEWYVPVAMPIVLEICPATTGEMDDTHLAEVCTTRRSGAQNPTCEVVPIVLCILFTWRKAQTSTLSGRASV